MKKILAGIALAASILGCAVQADKMPNAAPDDLTARGRYLVQIAGCNDCHTPGYAMKAGKVDEKQWLVGDSVGWQGPWGTTYPPNLRAYMEVLSEDEWIMEARTREMRPPMPWYELRVMPDDDLRALYRYIRTLSPIGNAAPPYLPPGTDAPPPVFKLVLPRGAAH